MSQRLLKYFLKLGATGFGGPLTLIQQMRIDLVQSEKLIEADQFDQAFTLIKAMPGPIAFQMAVHCGHKLNGLKGAFVSGLGLIFPAFVMMLVFGVYYTKISDITVIKNFFLGMQYAVVAIILFGLKVFFVNYKKSILFWVICMSSAVLFIYKIIPESLLIVGFGFMVVCLDFAIRTNKKIFYTTVAPLFFLIDFEKIKTVFKTCFMAGALVFGTGLAIFPFLQSQFVDQSALLSLAVFNDGVTLGQLTPGPVTISATFLGYQIAYFPGALAATIGLLLPPFFHMTTWFPRAMKWMSIQTWISKFTLGSTAAVVGCIFITVYKMNEAEFSNVFFWLIFCLSSLVLCFKTQFSIFKLLVIAGFLNITLVSLSKHTINL